MTEALPHPQLLLTISALRDRALEASSLNALAFSMANDLYPLLRFRQALVLEQSGERFRLLCVSGLAKPVEDSPYLVWLQRASRWIGAQMRGSEPCWLARGALDPPEEVSDGWAEWWPEGVWCVPLHGWADARLGLVLFLLDEPPPDVVQVSLEGLWRNWGYCWSALTGRRRRLGWRPSRRQAIGAAVVGALLLLLPVDQTALAPAEIVSRDAEIVSSPIDGVVAQMQIRPNQPVETGTPLLALDETTLRSRAEVLTKEVAVADAELAAMSQRAFDNPQSKGELTLLNGRAQERRAELAAVAAQLDRTKVLSPRPGVAVFSDPNDWLGKPVVTGERILLIA